MSDQPVTFFVPGEPVGKGRPRVTTIGGHARMFTPKKTSEYEAVTAAQARTAMIGRNPIQGPVMMEMRVTAQISKSWSKSKKAESQINYRRDKYA